MMTVGGSVAEGASYAAVLDEYTFTDFVTDREAEVTCLQSDLLAVLATFLGRAEVSSADLRFVGADGEGKVWDVVFGSRTVGSVVRRSTTVTWVCPVAPF